MRASKPTQGMRPERESDRAIRAGVFARLKRESKPLPMATSTDRMAQIVAEHLGEPLPADKPGAWEMLRRFAMAPVPGVTEPRVLDLLHRPPLRTSAQERFVRQQIEARRPGGG